MTLTSLAGIWIASRSGSGRECGFTLLELMVVLVMIGIISSFALATVNLNRADPPGLAAVERLAAVIEHQQLQATLRGEQRGLAIATAGFAVLVLVDEGSGISGLPADDWQTVGEVYPWRVAAPDGLSVDGRLLRLPSRPGAVPQLLLLSSGETSAFAMDFAADPVQPERGHYRLSSDLLGRLNVQTQLR